MNLINLGCGNRFHPDWTNIDLRDDPATGVRRMDLTKPFELADTSYDAVYSSHVLEHFHPLAAEPFVKECFRILKPGGILRLAVPDLEGITRDYLACLERCLKKNGEADPAETKELEADYDWMMLELYDQTVRDYPGGRMGERLSDPDLPNREFLVTRIGAAAKKVQSGRPNRTSIWHWETPTFRYSLRLGWKGLAEWFLNYINPTAYQELRHGRFRLCGEVHFWMYDRYSLGKLLQSGGFEDPRKCQATEGAIPDWKNYHLDANENEEPWKPDSLFMEARKPA